MSITYNEATKKLLHGFGNLFNNITVQRESRNGFKPVKLPIHFAPASYDIIDLLQNPSLTEIRPSLNLPFLAYEITRYEIDTTRKENRYYTRNACTANADGSFNLVRSPTPYNIGLNLYLFTQFLDDVFEVQERIYTGFNPKVTIGVKHSNGIVTQVPITFSGISKTDSYEGSPKDKSRLITTTFSFDAKMDFYRSIGEKTELIKVITLDYLEQNSDYLLETTQISVDPIDADITDNWAVKIVNGIPTVEPSHDAFSNGFSNGFSTTGNNISTDAFSNGFSNGFGIGLNNSFSDGFNNGFVI